MSDATDIDFPADFGHIDVCHVTTFGRRTGRRHRIEIWFGVCDGVMYLISGNGPGADWFLNLQAHPDVIVELGDQVRRGQARVVVEEGERHLVGDVMGSKHSQWGGDPDIGLTFEAWCYDVPAAAIEKWRSLD